MLADIEAGARDAVIAVDQDRIVRRMRELVPLVELLEQFGVPIVTTDGELDSSTADGIMRAQILGSAAENESRKKAERVSREAEQAARKGIARGSRRPFGYQKDKVTIREREAKLIREAAQRVLDGASAASIARDWNKRKIVTPQAAAYGWSASTIAGVLRNPRIAGARTYKGEIIKADAWPAIIDRGTFERLQGQIRRGTRPGRAPKRLLTSIARCGRCGAPMWTSKRTDSDGTKVPRYACIKRPGAPGCGATTIVAEPLDQLITDAVIHRLSTPAMTKALAPKPKKPKTPKVDLDLARIERDLEAIAADYGDGRITRREWLTARKRFEDRLGRARQALDTATATTALTPFRTGDIQVTWDKLDPDRKRVVLDTLIDRIIIRPATQPGRFETERIDVIWRA